MKFNNFDQLVCIYILEMEGEFSLGEVCDKIYNEVPPEKIDCASLYDLVEHKSDILLDLGLLTFNGINYTNYKYNQ